MAERRRSCWQCSRYDRTERHCRDNKTNPKTKRDSKEVAETLGVQALCLYNPYRDVLALRMYFPDRTPLFPPNDKRPRSRSRKQDDTESEIPPTNETSP
jgi:hypothetical protein